MRYRYNLYLGDRVLRLGFLTRTAAISYAEHHAKVNTAMGEWRRIDRGGWMAEAASPGPYKIIEVIDQEST